MTASQVRACRALADYLDQSTNQRHSTSDYIPLPWFELLDAQWSESAHRSQPIHASLASVDSETRTTTTTTAQTPWWWGKFVVNEQLWVELTRGQVMPTPVQGWYGCEPTDLPEPTGPASRRPPRRRPVSNTAQPTPTPTFTPTTVSSAGSQEMHTSIDANDTNAEKEEKGSDQTPKKTEEEVLAAERDTSEMMLEMTPAGDTPLAVAAAAQRQRYRALLNGRAFLTKYNTRRLYTVHDLDFSRDARKHGFQVGLSRTTFAQYYERRYDYTLSRELQPVLLHGTAAMPAHCSAFAVADKHGTPDPHSNRVGLFPELCQLLNVFSELLLYWRVLPSVIEHVSLHVDLLGCMEFLSYRFRAPRLLRQVGLCVCVLLCVLVVVWASVGAGGCACMFAHMYVCSFSLSMDTCGCCCCCFDVYVCVYVYVHT
jgi:PAZ domain